MRSKEMCSMYKVLFQVVVATVLVLDSVRGRPLQQNGGCPVGFDLREIHQNTCCKPVKCPANTFYVLCNGTADNPGYDSCHRCPSDRPVSEPINTAEAAKYKEVVDPCSKPDCKCPRPGAIPLSDSCLKDGIKRCECDRRNAYYGTDFHKCDIAADSIMSKVKQPGFELSKTGNARRCLPGTFKTTTDTSLCGKHSSCGEGFIQYFNGNSTEDVRCKPISVSPDSSKNESSGSGLDDHGDHGHREDKNGKDFMTEIILPAVLACCGVPLLVVFVIIYKRRTLNRAGRQELNNNQPQQQNSDEEAAEMHTLLFEERPNNDSSRPSPIEHTESDSNCCSRLIDTEENMRICDNTSRPLSESAFNVTRESNDLNNIIVGRSGEASENLNIPTSFRSENTNSNNESSIQVSNIQMKPDVQQKNKPIRINIYGDNNTVILPRCSGNRIICSKCVSTCHEENKRHPFSFRRESFLPTTDGEQLSTLFDINSMTSFPSKKNLAVPCNIPFVGLASHSNQNVENSWNGSEHFFPAIYEPSQFRPTPVIHEFHPLDFSSLWSDGISDIYFPVESVDYIAGCTKGENNSLSSITLLKNVHGAVEENAMECQCSVLSPQIEHSLHLTSFNSSSEQVNMQVPDYLINQSIQFENNPEEYNVTYSQNSVSSGD